jgi:hypothetical protein
MSRIEALESRIAPATVTVSLLGGALNLAGDGGPHDVTIRALDASTFQLTGAAGTLFHMDGVATDSDTLVLVSPLKSFTATLGDGDDKLSLIGLNIGGDVTIDGGAGTNGTNIDTVAIKGSLKITGGAGADTVKATGGTFSVKKDAIVELGDGGNSFTTEASLIQIGKSLSYTGGSGVDSFTVPKGGASIGGNLSITLGAGASTVGVQVTSIFSVGKNLIVDSSASLAGDTVSLSLTSYFGKIGGDLKITDGAANLSFTQYFIGLNSVRGNFNVVTGGGTSAFYFQTLQLTGKSITIDASASSSSTVSFIGYAGSILKGFKYTGGSGPDTVSFQVLGGAGRAFNSALDISLGDGDNSAAIGTYGSTFKTVSVTGGTGKDQVTLAAIGGKASSVKIDNGDGLAVTYIGLFNSTISGALSVINGADPGLSQLSFAVANSTIGSFDYTSEAGKNDISLGTAVAGGSGLPLTLGGLTVKKTMHIATGSGDDSLNFGTAANVKVGKEIKLELGDGTNLVTGTPSNVVTKKFSFTGGSGQDTISLVGASNNLGAVALTLGAGVNAATLSGGGAGTMMLSSLSFTSTSAAADTDSLTLARVLVSGKLDAKLGAGISALTIDDSTFGNLFMIDTGAGADTVKIDNGATNTGTVLVKAAVLNLGDGDDLLILGGNGTTSLLKTKAAFSADGGTGSNTLNNDGGNVFAKDPVFTNFPA